MTFQTKNAREDYLINTDDYDIVRTINHGGFGVINLVRNKKKGEQLAAKTNLIPNQKQNKLFISREVRILIEIQHSTIINFRGFSYTDFDHKNNITIFMEYMENGSLFEMISKEEKSLCPALYDNTKRQIILIGIARAMMILHSHHVIHRDLKPENILLDSNYQPRVTDFGLSKFFDPRHSMSQSIGESGTIAYMAPEVIEGDRFNTKADVYAFGILMFEVITGQRAYKALLYGKNKINDFQFKKKIISGYRPPFDEFKVKRSFQRMIESCWSQNPKERPTFTELYQKLSLACEDDIFEFEEARIERNKIDDDDADDENEEEDDEEAEFNISKKYCLDDVDVGEILDYVENIKEEPISMHQLQMQKIEKEKDELLAKMASKISSLESELSDAKSEAEKCKSQVEVLEKKIKDQASKISTFESGSPSLATKNQMHFFYQEPSLEEPGILSQLKKNENTPFDRLFIASMSSKDIYNLIDPVSKDFISSNDSGKFYIEFEFKEEMKINGIQIYSYKKDFPRSFDIEIDNKKVKSIKDAAELNGQNLRMTVNFDTVKGRKLCFIQTGPNWDQDNNIILIKRIELLSPDRKYSSGIFKSFVENDQSHDPHKCPVIITTLTFGLNYFHLLGTSKVVNTSNRTNSWFQVELTKGYVVLSGFRLKKCSSSKPKSFKLICTDDISLPEDKWISMIEINERINDDHDIADIYEFQRPSPPVRFIRLVQTGPNWDDKLNLKFHHFDIFGSYI